MKGFFILLWCKHKLNNRMCSFIIQSVISILPDFLPCEVVNATYMS